MFKRPSSQRHHGSWFHQQGRRRSCGRRPTRPGSHRVRCVSDAGGGNAHCRVQTLSLCNALGVVTSVSLTLQRNQRLMCLKRSEYITRVPDKNAVFVWTPRRSVHCHGQERNCRTHVRCVLGLNNGHGYQLAPSHVNQIGRAGQLTHMASIHWTRTQRSTQTARNRVAAPDVSSEKQGRNAGRFQSERGCNVRRIWCETSVTGAQRYPWCTQYDRRPPPTARMRTAPPLLPLALLLLSARFLAAGAPVDDVGHVKVRLFPGLRILLEEGVEGAGVEHARVLPVEAALPLRLLALLLLRLQQPQ